MGRRNIRVAYHLKKFRDAYKSEKSSRRFAISKAKGHSIKFVKS